MDVVEVQIVIAGELSRGTNLHQRCSSSILEERNRCSICRFRIKVRQAGAVERVSTRGFSKAFLTAGTSKRNTAEGLF